MSSDELRVPAAFRHALARTGLTVGEAIARTAFSSRSAAKNCARLRDLLDGKALPPLEHVRAFAGVLGMDLAALDDALAADAATIERRRREERVRALEPVTPDEINEALVGLVVFKRHPVSAGATREEALDLAKKLARDTGHRIFVPAFRGAALFLEHDGEKLVERVIEPNYGARFGSRIVRFAV